MLQEGKATYAQRAGWKLIVQELKQKNRYLFPFNKHSVLTKVLGSTVMKDTAPALKELMGIVA
jgi:hypothetical protein